MYHINKVIFIFYENVFSFSLCQYGYEEKWTYICLLRLGRLHETHLKKNETLALSLRRVSVSFRYQSESQTTLRLFDWWISFSLCHFHIWRIISSETSSTF